jgi:pimeloyl-ACP methyl ester carboxylesterase
MQQTVRTLSCALLAILAYGALPCAAAQASIAWKPCPDSNNVACAKLGVPLDPADPTQGTITLSLRRHLAPVGEAKDAVIALAGGPGQAALPFVSQFGTLLGPILSTRDLIVFDQRGTGLSHPLSCAAFEHVKGGLSPLAVGICGGQIGSTRGFYTTADTTADIEAIRQAAGYEKLVLYGTSYGTKVAERYAQDHPSRVEALVLDSVVPPNGPEAFDNTTFAAIRRVLRQLCSGGVCAHITHNPVGDLARLVKRMGGRSVRGRTIDGEGKAKTTHVSSNDLLSILLEGDFDPILRSEFPAAVRSAVRGDDAALARLATRAEGGEDEENEEELSEGFNIPLYFSTICDESAFPWNRAVNGRKRFHEALTALRAAGSSAFAPFTASNALALSDVADCAGWPLTGGPEVNSAPLPDVPTLILSGANDLRTPTANARLVARQIPDSNLLVVPYTGHSVLSADPTPCAHNALQALFRGKPVMPCKATIPPSPLLLPTPLPPRKIAEVPPALHNPGLAGRTVTATEMALLDFDRQMLLAVVENLGEALFGSGSVRVGGLRAGWGGFLHGHLTLHGYSYVPGVTVSGKISSTGRSTLRIGGSAAADGTVKVSANGALSGVLGGRHVSLGGPQATKVGLTSPAAFAPSRLSGLVTNPKRLAALWSQGPGSLLREAPSPGG